LEQISNKSFGIQTLELPIGGAYKKDAGLTHFLKGKYNGNAAMPLDAQESYRMRSFAEANCLIQLDEDVTDCEAGTSVKVHLLPI
jgi:molybdopterin molybdotransferase